MNRYLNQAGSIFMHHKRLRLLPRHFVSPTKGIKRAPERADPERYFTPEEFKRLVAASRVIDRTWKRMPALITVAYHTGLRVGARLNVRGKDVDFANETIFIARTKNGDPITASLSTDAIRELKALPKVKPDELVFGSTETGKPFVYARYGTQSRRRRNYRAASFMNCATVTATNSRRRASASR